MSMEAREERGAQIAKAGCVKARTDHLWVVPSQTGPGSWVVDLSYGDDKVTCTCPDFEKRNLPCKHIFAVELLRLGTVDEAVDQPKKRKTYKQAWTAYNLAQMNETDHFVSLLRALCDGIKMPEQKRAGRPRLPLCDIVFAAALKVYGLKSGRRSTCAIKKHEDKLVADAPHYNSISRYLRDPNLTPLLRTLIQESASPLAGVESQFAVDSSGFSTTTYDRWFDEKWGKTRSRAKWRKAHIACGVLTNVITDLIVDDAGDATKFKELLDATSGRFTVLEVSADKAYISHANLDAANEIGAVPYIPFKSNHTGNGPKFWSKMFHYFSFRREDFLSHYHARSNVETCFSMIKMKFGAALRSKDHAAQVNELHLKVLCHNICVLVSSMYELGIVAEFWQEAK